MSVVVTGATGPFGRLVVESLLAAGLPAEQIVAGGRRLELLADLAERGVQVRRLDYNDPDSLTAGFAGADKVLIVSGTEFGRRVEQHTTAARTAQQAGARLVAYTSAPHADTTAMLLATEHRLTEEGIRQLGVPFTFLRNSWYFENYTARIPEYLERGEIIGSAGEGLISGAPRADYAAAAAAVLLGDGHENTVYELGGDTGFTVAELARVIGQAAGRTIGYRDLPLAEFTAILAAGLPQPLAEVFADVDRAISDGELHITTGDLGRLIGRPTGSLTAAVQAALVPVG